jgi:hypothetical protein
MTSIDFFSSLLSKIRHFSSLQAKSPAAAGWAGLEA